METDTGCGDLGDADGEATGNGAEQVSSGGDRAPRIGVGESLVDLVRRAEDAIAEQKRLRRLLHAYQMLVGDAGLPEVLERVTRAAMDLTGAHYAALGVLGDGGTIVQFVHLGDPSGTSETVGHPPRGRGLLGALIDNPSPIRLADLTEDPRSCGVPHGHPPMRGFLGVPIRIGARVFGNLYLTDDHAGVFSAADERLLVSLAGTAATVIDNARRHAKVIAHERWLVAATSLARVILDGSDTDMPRLIAEHAREAADAGSATVLLRELHTTTLTAAVGSAVSGETAFDLDRAQFLEAFAEDRPVLLTPPEPAGNGVASAMVLPLQGVSGSRGVLVAARDAARPRFTRDELEAAAEYARHAAVALELAELHAETGDAALAAERDRIANELHDRVIHGLFRAGLALHGTAALVGTGEIDTRIRATIDDLDRIIQQIRATIYGLQQLRPLTPPDLHRAVLDTIAEMTSGSGESPELEFSGNPAAGGVTVEVIDDITTVLHEVLAHSIAPSALRISVRAAVYELALEIRTPQPIDLPPDVARRLTLSAQRHGGALVLAADEPEGALLRWSAPNS